MQYKFNKHLQNLLPDRPLKILAAVSGGADSMCLLYMLLNSNIDIDLSVAHMNFNLRGAESDADQKLVCEWASANGVRVFVKSVDTIQWAKQHSVSIEMAARELRYNWFYSLKNEYGFDYIALAHHANDNAETLLLNLVRGAGIAGICGMKELDEERSLLRPMLCFTRSEIERYVALKEIPYRVDSTNSDIKYHRNRIRNVVIPELEKINPSAVHILNRDMGYFSDVSGIIKELFEKKRETLILEGRNTVSIFRSIRDKKVQRYMELKYVSALVSAINIDKLLEEKHYKYWLYEILSDYLFNSSQIEDMAVSLFSVSTKKIISEKYTAVKERGFIKIYATDRISFPFDEPVQIGEFEGSKEVVLCNNRILFEVCNGFTENKDGKSLVISFDKLKFPLMLRTPENGDKWRPFGIRGTKKLSDYLTDIKMDSVLKSGVPVLCSSTCCTKENPDHIICLPGLEISDYYKVTASDEKVLRITLME